MDVEIRTLRREELEAFLRVSSTAFGMYRDEQDMERHAKVLEVDRTLVATDRGEIVAGAGACTFQLTVPGNVVPCAGISSVVTLPTHRRRGLARAMMRRQHEDVRERDEPLAYLWASEAAIYQRFGYGVGALAAEFEIDRPHTTFLREFGVPGRIRMAARDEALKLVPEVYERVRPTRPGMLDRPGNWWDHRFGDTEQHRKGASPLFFGIYERAEGIEGYVAYRIKDAWNDAGPDYRLNVVELVATSPEAYAALWRYCFEVDLVRHVKGWNRPVDEPLLHMLAEPRALRFQLRDGPWLRLVDAPRALAARRYRTEDRIVFGLNDEFSPWNRGIWALEGGPDGATCGRSGAGADLELETSDLASAYLGAVSFRVLAAAGRVVERKAGALGRADAMFASSPAPWCPHVF